VLPVLWRDSLRHCYRHLSATQPSTRCLTCWLRWTRYLFHFLVFFRRVHRIRISGNLRPESYLDETWVKQKQLKIHLAELVKEGRLASFCRKRIQAYCIPCRISKTDFFSWQQLQYPEEGPIIMADNATTLPSQTKCQTQNLLKMTFNNFWETSEMNMTL
jgi:hypothetical protein